MSYIIWNVSHYRWVHMAQFCEWEWKNAEEGTVVTGCTMHGVSFHTYHIMTVTLEREISQNKSFSVTEKGGSHALRLKKITNFIPKKCKSQSIAQDP